MRTEGLEPPSFGLEPNMLPITPCPHERWRPESNRNNLGLQPSTLPHRSRHRGSHKGFEPFPQAPQTCMLPLNTNATIRRLNRESNPKRKADNLTCYPLHHWATKSINWPEGIWTLDFRLVRATLCQTESPAILKIGADCCPWFWRIYYERLFLRSYS